MPKVTQRVTVRGWAQTQAIGSRNHLLSCLPSLPLALSKTMDEAHWGPSGSPFSPFLFLLTPSTLFPQVLTSRVKLGWGEVCGQGQEQSGRLEADQGWSAGVCLRGCPPQLRGQLCRAGLSCGCVDATPRCICPIMRKEV